MTDKAKNILIGLFLITAVTIAVAMILFLEPKIGDGKKTLLVRFSNIAGIVVGTRVTFAGKPVGEVLHIHELPEARTEPDETGRLYFYELILKTDSCVEVYNTDEIAIRSTGLMGEKSVAILPKSGPSAKLITDHLIYANSIDPLENTFNQVTKTASRLEEIVTHLDTWFQTNSNDLGNGIQNLNHVLVHANEALISIEQIAKNLSIGSGTIGRFLANDDFYLRLSSTLSKAETMMNDINHYGLLFQYDKHWQRSRTKKANLLKSLDSPKEFRAYFEGEVDSITTSLGRISSLLEQIETLDEKNRIIENEQFIKDFSTLLRSSQSLTDTIRLYLSELTSP